MVWDCASDDCPNQIVEQAKRSESAKVIDILTMRHSYFTSDVAQLNGPHGGGSTLSEQNLSKTMERERLDLIQSTLYTLVIGDILDTLGYFHQFLPQPIQPMQERDEAGRESVPGPDSRCLGEATGAVRNDDRGAGLD